MIPSTCGGGRGKCARGPSCRDGKQESLANELATKDEVKVVLTGDLRSETDDICGIRATHDVALQWRLTGVIGVDDEVLLW